MADEFIVLIPDDKAVSLKITRDIFFAAKQLHDLIEKDKLSKETLDTICPLIEYHLADLASTLHFDSKSKENVEKRHSEVRRLNHRIHDLERQLGSQNPIDGLGEQLSYLSEILKKWWRLYGFGYIGAITFQPYGLEVEFGISFMRTFTFSKTPVSDRESRAQWIEDLKTQGYDIYTGEHSRETVLVDCDKNKAMLLTKIKERFPTCEILEWKSRKASITGFEGQLFEIDGMKVYVRDLREVKSLEEVLGDELQNGG